MKNAPNTPSLLSRRSFLSMAALPLFSACGTPLPLVGAPTSSAPAATRLADSAAVHGLQAYRQLTDINVAYGGQWRPLIDRIQPEVVDAGFRGPSQERLMPLQGIVAQAYTGPRGQKQVFWQRGGAEVDVWFNGVRSSSASARAASALVAEAYGLFLLGPLWLTTRQAERALPLALGGTELVNGRLCDIVHAWLSPGLGQVATDRVSLFIDRDDSITRRLRFTLEGFVGTRGAVAEVDTFDHERRFGVLWPMRSYEEVVHPIRLPAHDWHITGLDVNRGYEEQALRGAQFSGAAAAPAARLT